MTSFVPFISFILISAYTPGPNNIMSMLNASKVGIKKAWIFNVGIAIGFSILMILCGIFTDTLANALPMIKPVLKYIGAAYILWLAYKTYHSTYQIDESINQVSYTLKEGMLLQFVNPKAILFGITTLSTFVIPYYSGVTVLLFSLILAVNTFFATMSWGLFGSAFHHLLITKTKQVNIVMALALVYTAITLII